VVTFHTVLAEPNANQRRIVTELADMAETSVVMSRAAAALLAAVYGADPVRTVVIPHGIPDLPFVASDTIKPRLNLQGKSVLLSFGLLGPDKGFETAIEAMPAVAAAVPTANYVILGATHPGNLSSDGEAYRASLEAQVAKLGMAKNVTFVDRFVGRVELGTWLEAADIFVTPYLNLDLSVSGTLAYGMAAGKAIVSTPYAYATEQLAPDRGRLVPAGSPRALAESFIELLLDPEIRTSMGRRAYDYSRKMVWWEVGAEYRRILDRASRSTVSPVRASRSLAIGVA
jgi:glycosyltransferase involved in cell wall biosynthesis